MIHFKLRHPISGGDDEIRVRVLGGGDVASGVGALVGREAVVELVD